MAMLPKLAGPPQPITKVLDARNAAGRTVDRIELGAQERPSGMGPSEAMIIHFTDGSALSVEIGTNAQIVAQRHEGLAQNEFETDLMVWWVPPGRDGHQEPGGPSPESEPGGA